MEESFFLNIYDLAFNAKSAEVFNEIAENITIILKAYACSIWINNYKVENTETRLGYYEDKNHDKLSQIDYDLSYKTLIYKETIIDKIIDDEGTQWYYVTCPFNKGDITGCYTIWFSNWIENPFRKKYGKVVTLKKLGNIFANVISHFLRCDKFDCNRILSELSAAEKIQRSLIPTEIPKINNINIGIRSIMANEVGGDYLDLIQFNNEEIGIVVGDAMGKGIPGAFIMLITRTLFRILCKANVNPEVLLRQLNLFLTPELIQQNIFVSLFYGIYDIRSRVFKYAVAGHNPPLIFRRRSREIETLEGKGIIIGGKHRTEYKAFDTSLEKGDIILLYTDGVQDIRNSENKVFGIEGMKRVIQKYSEYDADGISNCLAQVISKHGGHKLNDDASFIVLKAE